MEDVNEKEKKEKYKNKTQIKWDRENRDKVIYYI